MAHSQPTVDRQASIRQFVTHLAERGGYEPYWIQLHGQSFNDAEKETILRHSRPPRRPAIALDAGCGEGRLALHLARTYDHVYATDFSERSCACLKEQAADANIGNLSVHCQDLLQPIDLPQVDTVLLIQVLQHFDKVSDRIQALKNLKECVTVGGRIVITVFNHDRVLNRLRRTTRDVDKRPGYPYYHYFQAAELRRLLEAAGWANVRMRGCINVPAFIHEYARGNALARIDAELSRWWWSRYLGIYLLAEAERLRG